MEKITKLLFQYSEKEYGDFIASLTPTVSRDNFIGVRVPLIRGLVKELSDSEKEQFLNELPHKHYEENLLHGFIIQKMKNYDECIKRVEEYLPYINNWACTDTMMPLIFKKNKNDVFKHINRWVKSNKTYSVRFAILCLMNLFLDKDFKKEYLLIPQSIKSEEYYINIMISWYYATALAKQYDETIKVIESKKLDKWVQNKSIQKAIESRRVSDDKKAYLRTLKK